ncbi:hypothetical protein AWI43_17230 [Streptomyces sp. WAC04657]|nr:hypothetical protein AWI43_17230 [Streptomyces sp. WAC04657]
MVHFDVVGAERTVGSTEVEGAHLASNGLVQSPDLPDLSVTEVAVPFAVESQADQQTAFLCTRLSVLAHFVRMGRGAVQFAAGDSRA